MFLLLSQYVVPPIGTIFPYVGDLEKIPAGWHLCDGTNGTPDLTGRFLEGTTNAPKIFNDAGLPNITGCLIGENETYYAGGAFRHSGGGSVNKTEDNYGNQNDVYFNAS